MIETINKTEQLKSIILEDIRNGVYSHEDFPSIRALSKKYGVCKHTVSQALFSLKEIGALKVHPGKSGTVNCDLAQKNIAVLYIGMTPLSQSEFGAELFRGIEEGIRETGKYSYNTYSLPEGDSIGSLDENLDRVHTAGILLVGSDNPYKLSCLKKYKIPFTVVGTSVNDADVSFVAPHMENEVFEEVDLFVRKGRRKIAFIGNIREGSPSSCEKTNPFFNVLKKNKIKISEKFIKKCSHLPENGYVQMKEILEAPEIPDAVFCTSDLLAVGIYRAIHERKLRIPQDIAVASCDDLEIAAYLSPSLTTVRMPRYEIGYQSVKQLMAKISGRRFLLHKIIPSELILRESI